MFNLKKMHAGVCAATLLLGTFALNVAVAADQQGLSSNEVRGTGLSTQWQGTAAVMTRGPDGKVIYLYGQTQPSVVCSPLQLCEIELQAGEAVRDVLVGDTVRWKVEPATSGSAEGQKIHLIVKPSELTPFIGLKIGEIFERAGLPENVLQIITGDGQTGAALVDAGIEKIMFTGSVSTGKKIAASAANAPGS